MNPSSVLSSASITATICRCDFSNTHDKSLSVEDRGSGPFHLLGEPLTDGTEFRTAREQAGGKNKIFDWLAPGVHFSGQLKADNRSVAIFLAGLFIGLGLLLGNAVK